MNKVCSKCKEEKPVESFYTRNGKPDSWCKDCYKKARSKYRETAEAKEAERVRRQSDKYKQIKYLSGKKYREANKEKLKEKKKLYYENNKERHRENSRLNYLLNMDKYKERTAKWQKENPHRVNATCMKRHAAKLNATPDWLSDDELWMIEEAYHLAKLREKVVGGKWHVDHIVPLQGKIVCGLHVPWNLQVIPASENCSKRNSFEVYGN